MQLGENLHMQAREPGEGRGVFGQAKERVQIFFLGGSNHQKRSLLKVPSIGGSIDQGGLRIRMLKSYQESQLKFASGPLRSPRSSE